MKHYGLFLFPGRVHCDEWGVITIPAGKPIKVGMGTMLTGDYASLGIDIRHGAELAVEDNGPILGRSVILQAGGTSTNGAYVTYAKGPDPARINRFESRYGPRQTFSPQAYDATTVLIRAVAKTAQERADGALVIGKKKLRDAVASTGYDGITGRSAFDPNGAGKTTLLNTISCLLPCRGGAVFFDGKEIHGLPAHRVVRAGVSQVPEGRKVFSRLTVTENLEMGAFLRRDHREVRRDADSVFRLFPRLRERRSQVAGTLSGGEQQMLAIGRALMSRPRLLLLDEPSMGLAPVLVESIFDTITAINREGTTVLLVEQNAWMAFQIATWGYVIQSGEIVLEDSAERLQEDAIVIQLYLGG